MAKLAFKSTADLTVSGKLVEQVIGQESAVEVISKAAEQRRHVLLIGSPGTGKSMLGTALAELLPKEKLLDTLSFPNPNDENAPLIRTLAAGQGRELVARAKIQSMGMLKNPQMIFMLILGFLSTFVVPFWVRSRYQSDVMFAAFFLGGMLILAMVAFSMSVGKRMAPQQSQIPRLIVDNFRRKQAPFNDATGAHAGALLGDVLHDPFQSFLGYLYIKKYTNGLWKNVQLNAEIDSLFRKNKASIVIDENGYEAIHLAKNSLFVQGETNSSVSPVDILSCNRYDYDGHMIKLTTSENKELIVTPEHKIAIWKDGKISYVEAQSIQKGCEVVAKSEDIIIDEQDIINTYDARQQDQCRLYYHYLEIKAQNPTWGYKRIAKAMGQELGKTRWWHAKKHIPVPIQTSNWLKERGLLPLRVDNPKLPLIAKVVGATFGNGGIFENLNAIFLSSSDVKDTEEFSNDLQSIFGNDVILNADLREGGEYGHSWCMWNTNKNLIRFFITLDAPLGNKTNKNLIIPNWIKSKRDLADEFYGSLFGGELGVSKKHDKNLIRIEFAITGSKDLEENRIVFLTEIIDYLRSNFVTVTAKEIDVSNIHTEKARPDTKKYRFILSQNPSNIQAFTEKIKINYCNLKKFKLLTAVDRDMRDKLIKYLDFRAKGLGAESIMKRLEIEPKYLYKILNNTHINLNEVEAST